MFEDMLDKFYEEREAFLENKEAELKKKNEEAACRILDEILKRCRDNGYVLNVSVENARLKELLNGADWECVETRLNMHNIIAERTTEEVTKFRLT